MKNPILVFLTAMPSTGTGQNWQKYLQVIPKTLHVGLDPLFLALLQHIGIAWRYSLVIRLAVLPLGSVWITFPSEVTDHHGKAVASSLLSIQADGLALHSDDLRG